MIGISKSQQLQHKAPLKPKPIKDKTFLSWMHSQGFGCIVCNSPYIELHHVKNNSTDIKNDREVLPLCNNHHQHDEFLSPHRTPKKWREVYPIEEQRAIAHKYYLEYKSETN